MFAYAADMQGLDGGYRAYLGGLAVRPSRLYSRISRAEDAAWLQGLRENYSRWGGAEGYLLETFCV